MSNDTAKKQREANIKRHGSYEAYLEFMRNIGKKGGQTNPHVKGGFHDKKLAKRAGDLGRATRWGNKGEAGLS